MKNIGVVPGVRLRPDLNWYLGEYFFTDTYVSRVVQTGGLPVGVIASHGRIDTRILEHCDAFLLCGGQRILPYQLQVVDYAVTHHRPLLGVCLGMQAVHSYFIVREEAARRGWDGDLLDLYDTMKKERYYFVEPVPDHNSTNPASYAEENIHPVRVAAGTELAKYLPVVYGTFAPQLSHHPSGGLRYNFGLCRRRCDGRGHRVQPGSAGSAVSSGTQRRFWRTVRLSVARSGTKNLSRGHECGKILKSILSIIN